MQSFLRIHFVHFDIAKIPVIEVGKKDPFHHCTICPSIFDRLDDLKAHISESHPTEKHKYRCSFCNKTFPNGNALASHISYSHKNKNKTNFEVQIKLSTNNNEEKGIKKKPFQCSFCFSRFDYLDEAIRHMTSIHKNRHPYECSICKKTYSNKRFLTTHIEKYHTIKESNPCSICHQGGFVLKSELAEHIYQNHSFYYEEHGHFECGLCYATFKSTKKKKSTKNSESTNRNESKRMLQNHILVCFEKVKPYDCSICKKKFEFSTHVEGHMSVVHPNAKGVIF